MSNGINYARVLDDCVEREVSVNAFCQKVGISRSSFYRFRAQRKLSSKMLDKLIDMYHLDISYYIEFAPDFSDSAEV
jgi:ACT domain-containing protein